MLAHCVSSVLPADMVQMSLTLCLWANLQAQVIKLRAPDTSNSALYTAQLRIAQSTRLNLSCLWTSRRCSAALQNLQSAMS